MDNLDGLNEHQKEAVSHTEGPLMVLAGAGSGKTRVITHRIIHLIEQGVAPYNILAVTFTNKAAKEMRGRIDVLLREQAASARAAVDSKPLLTTFHALGVRMLRENHETLGLRRSFVIYDRSDSNKVIKRGLENAGYNIKQFEPRKIMSMISRAKGDAMSVDEYRSGSSSYGEKVAAEVWKFYDKTLKAEHALDFDDLLIKTLNMLKSHPEILEKYQNRFLYIHVDEYQDTNKVQFEMVKLLAGSKNNVCVVGDIDQCLTKGTKITMADGSKKPIEKVKEGELVISNFGSGDLRPSKVTGTYSKTTSEDLVSIKTNGGKKITSTKNHTHFAGYRTGISPQTHFVYLMYKAGVGYRIGTTQMYTKGQRKPVAGFVQRSNQEKADALWILSTHKDTSTARVSEYKLSLLYQIPTLPFVARKGGSTGGYVHDQSKINEIFSSFDTARSSKRLLKDLDLLENFPHHRPQTSKGKRQNILVSLCGDRRGKTAMHRISVAGNDQEARDLLASAGYSVRLAKSGSKSWRFETCNMSFEKISKEVVKIKKILPHATLVSTARLGKQGSATVEKNSLPFIPATSIRVGMAMFDESGAYDIVSSVSIVRAKGVKTTLYDLDIKDTHNFIANSVFTHNSIYSWRGADIQNILQFEKHFPEAKTILLEENYRSTQTIISASNDIITKNVNRPEKNVFTNNVEGEKIELYTAMNGQDEAEYVAMTAKQLIKDGVSPSSIAVLYRTNFQSRGLEESFLNFNVPYQLLGTKFFERKEIKDTLSFLRLALNTDSTADLTRIVNTPPRGIGKVTLLKLVEGRREELKGKTAEKVLAFELMMEEINTMAETKSVSDTLKFIIKRTGIEDHYRRDGEEGVERIENLRELVTLGTKYNEFDSIDGLERLLEDAALQSDQDEMKEKKDQDAVRLMTVHAAKGLEFPYVFVTGLEEGLFPHEKLGDESVDTEEERRLFYVALTRAERKVFLSFAHIRMIFGSERVNVPSSFLNDISDEHVERSNPIESGFEKTILLD